MLGLHFTPACVLLLVCSLHFTHSLHFIPGPQSVFYTDRKLNKTHLLGPNGYCSSWSSSWEKKLYFWCLWKQFIRSVTDRHFMYIEYFMESAGVRYLHTSCWYIRNRTSEHSEWVRFLIKKQRVRKYRTKHFPCGIVFIIYILRNSSFWQPFYFQSFQKLC